KESSNQKKVTGKIMSSFGVTVNLHLQGLLFLTPLWPTANLYLRGLLFQTVLLPSTNAWIDCDLGTYIGRLQRRLCLYLVRSLNYFEVNFYLSLHTCLGSMHALGSVTFLSLSLFLFLSHSLSFSSSCLNILTFPMILCFHAAALL
ncbi:hypothetical protein PanWU01x14_179820, partial [Parasponia andersonii]